MTKVKKQKMSLEESLVRAMPQPMLVMLVAFLFGMLSEHQHTGLGLLSDFIDQCTEVRS